MTFFDLPTLVLVAALIAGTNMAYVALRIACKVTALTWRAVRAEK